MRELTGTLLSKRADRNPFLWESWLEPFLVKELAGSLHLWEGWQEPIFIWKLTGNLLYERVDRKPFFMSELTRKILWESWQEPFLMREWSDWNPFWWLRQAGAEENPLYERACSNPFYDTGAIREPFFVKKSLHPQFCIRKLTNNPFVSDS